MTQHTTEHWQSWMAAAQEGDGAAYALLLRDALPLLRAVARRHLAEPAAQERAVQDTLRAIHRLRAHCDPARPVRRWVEGIAEQCCRRRARTERPSLFLRARRALQRALACSVPRDDRAASAG